MKGQFYRVNSLRRIVITAIIIFFIAQVLGVSLHYYSKHQNQQEQKRLAAIESARSPSDKAIEKAQQHLKAKVASIDPATRLMLDYVQRKFDLDSSLGAPNTPFDLMSEKETYPNEIDYVARIAYPDNVLRRQPNAVSSPVSYVNIYSANCDHLGLSPQFWDTVETNISRGGYYAAHNALAFLMIKDNQCETAANYMDLKNRTFDVMSKTATSYEVEPDLRYEAITLLLVSGEKDRLSSDVIDGIIKEQRPDGSWRGLNADTYMDEHATLLAMWALLEYQNPNKPHSPLIRH